jgi:hypothetical protein
MRILNRCLSEREMEKRNGLMENFQKHTERGLRGQMEKSPGRLDLIKP